MYGDARCVLDASASLALDASASLGSGRLRVGRAVGLVCVGFGGFYARLFCVRDRVRKREMWRGGNDQVGFEVSYDAVTRIMYLRMWGIWDEPLAIKYRDTVAAVMRPLTPERESFVLADLARYPTQKPSVQKYHAELMGKSASHGIRRSANLVEGTLTSMQIRRLSQESGVAEFSFFQDEAKAVAWLLSDEKADEDAVAKLPGRRRQ